MTPRYSIRLYEPHYTSSMARIAAESNWALLPVANRPLLCHWLDALRTLGAPRVEVFLYQHQREVQEHIGTGDAWGVEIAYQSSPEESTAQVNLDMSIWCTADQLESLIAHTARKGLLMADKGGLVGFAAFPGHTAAGLAPTAAGAPSGIALLHHPVDYLAANVAGIPTQGHVGGPPSLGFGTYPPSSCVIIHPVLIGNHTILEADTRIGPHVVIGEGCRIGRGCRIENSVILPNTVVPPHAVVVGKIVSPAQTLGDEGLAANSAEPSDPARIMARTSLKGSLRNWLLGNGR